MKKRKPPPKPKHEAAIDAIKRIIENGYDKEHEHLVLDDLLCDILSAEGYKEVVEIYRSREKWYA